MAMWRGEQQLRFWRETGAVKSSACGVRNGYPNPHSVKTRDVRMDCNLGVNDASRTDSINCRQGFAYGYWSNRTESAPAGIFLMFTAVEMLLTISITTTGAAQDDIRAVTVFELWSVAAATSVTETTLIAPDLVPQNIVAFLGIRKDGNGGLSSSGAEKSSPPSLSICPAAMSMRMRPAGSPPNSKHGSTLTRSCGAAQPKSLSPCCFCR